MQGRLVSFNYRYHNTIFDINIGIIIIVAIILCHNKSPLSSHRSRSMMMSRNTMMMTTLVKTLSVRCQDAQCYVTDQGCSQLPNQMTSFLCGHKARQMPSSQAHNTILVIESKCHRKHIAIILVIESGRFHKQNALS